MTRRAKLDNLKIEDMRRAKRLVICKDNTTVVERTGRTKHIDGRVKQIRAEIEETTSEAL